MGWFTKDSEDDAPADREKPAEPFVTKYGTWCRSRLVRESDDLPPEYLEAWQQGDSSHRWSLQKVGIETKDDSAEISARIVRKDLSFQQAIAEMAAFEHSRDVLPGEMEGTTAEALGFDHYRRFAEREGFVFDANNMPRERPHPNAQPPGRFNQSDLESAAKSVKEAESAPVVNRKEDLLSEVFNGLTARGDFDAVIDALQNAGELEEFGNAISSFKSDLHRMASNPDYVFEERSKKLPGRSLFSEDRKVGYKWSDGDYDYYLSYFDKAADALEKAQVALNTLSRRGHDAKPAQQFLHECVAATCLVRAQAFFVKLQGNPGSDKRDEYAKMTRAYEEQARKICRKHLDLRTQEDFDKLKQAVIQGSVTATPKFIDKFLDAYNDWRRDTRRDLGNRDYNLKDRNRRFLGREAF